MNQDLWLAQKLNDQYQNERLKQAEYEQQIKALRNQEPTKPRRNFLAKLRAELNNWNWQAEAQSKQDENDERLLQPQA